MDLDSGLELSNEFCVDPDIDAAGVGPEKDYLTSGRRRISTMEETPPQILLGTIASSIYSGISWNSVDPIQLLLSSRCVFPDLSQSSVILNPSPLLIYVPVVIR